MRCLASSAAQAFVKIISFHIDCDRHRLTSFFQNMPSAQAPQSLHCGHKLPSEKKTEVKGEYPSSKYGKHV